MSNLLSSLKAAANSMKAYERALTVVQNNVTNATTPGYVSQRVDFVALPFQPELELAGGVGASGLISSRDAFLEAGVWRQASRHGRLEQLSSALNQVEPIFDIAEGSGVAGALDRLYSAFSQLTVTPNDNPTRQTVIRRAQDTAQAFNFSASALSESGEHARRQMRSFVDQINTLAGDIRDLNVEFRKDYRKQEDAGLDARMHSALEQLSELVDINTLPQADGSITVLLGGQTPLVIGDRVYEIQADLGGVQAEITDYNGQVITDQVSQGKLKALLEFHNDLLPTYAGELDRLAASAADRINAILGGGVDLNGLPPAVDLFQYDPASSAALSLSVTDISADQIAAATAAAPGGNTNALALADLAASPEIDGFTFTEFYGEISARVGSDVNSATEDEHSSSLLLAQAQYLRDEASAVNLDQEAAAMLQYQRAYQASAQMLGIMNEMTDTLMSILR